MTISKDITPLTADERAAVELLRVIGIEASTWAPRLDRVLRNLHDDEHPLNAVDYDPSSRSRTRTSGDGEGGDWEIHDPTGDRAINGPSTGQERARARRLVRQLNDTARELVGMFQTHDPQPTKGVGVTENNRTEWCANPAHPHDSREPRHGRHRHCRFCENILAEFGKLPTRDLIDRRGRPGYTLTGAMIRQLLDT